MSEIATRLSEALPGDGALQLWDAVDAQQQQAILTRCLLVWLGPVHRVNWHR
jgi:hypothetical protein